MNINILIGGKAGDGLNTVLDMITSSYSKIGLYVHSYKDYMSRVRGGHNFVQILISDKVAESFREEIDIIFAFDDITLPTHINRLKDSGLAYYSDKFKFEHKNAHKLNFAEILKVSNNLRGKSSISYGAISKAAGIDKDVILNFKSKKWTDEITKKNIDTATLAYDMANKNSCIEIPNNELMYLSGNHAVALAAATAGVKFYCAYPMAPSTSVMNYLNTYSKHMGIAIEQAEDEVAAMNAIIGSSSTGLRSMTGSSGGGICHMSEAIGFSGIAEVPTVIIDVQRPGPATGLATRTEQSDLHFITNISHGEYPKIVLSLRTVEDCFYKTFKAFNLADKYRVPVILLSDQYLADSGKTIAKIDFDSLRINRHITDSPTNYKHHSFDLLLYDRALPGNDKLSIMTDSHEHNEVGNISEDSSIRVSMMNRRMSKMELIREELDEPDYIGSDNPKTLFVAFGSICSQLREAYYDLNDPNIGILMFSDVFPLPLKNIRKYAKLANKIISVEQNYSSQLAELITKESGII
ncbi:MAG: 2-oxoacid:acceptor oxidoreductase subunit alpha, partial [Acidaminobacteraceae bacterium]